MQRWESGSHGTGRQVQLNFSFVQAACAIGMCHWAVLRTSKILPDHPHVSTRLGNDMIIFSLNDMTVTSIVQPP